MATSPGRGRLSVALQDSLLRRRFPGFAGRLRKGEGIWRGPVRPTPRSRCYTIEIRYRLGKRPRVRVVDPAPLPTREGERPPHLYREGSLCLFHPNRGEFGAEDRIDQTIVPWVSTWLYFYELWLWSGEWLGGGDHPRTRKERKSSRLLPQE